MGMVQQVRQIPLCKGESGRHDASRDSAVICSDDRGDG